MSEFSLTGLNGCNPLGYLAALGTLRVTTMMYPELKVRMRWQSIGGWRPSLLIAKELDVNQWITGLDSFLRRPDGDYAFTIAKDLSIPCPVFREHVLACCSDSKNQDRTYADFMAAFGSEIVESVVNGKKTGNIADTAFRTMGGAGHQHFLGSMYELTQNTDATHLRTALLQNWKYDDPRPSLRWDPFDDRRYAQRWTDPSKDPSKTVRGANRLAIEALPLFPTAPNGTRLETTGFTQGRGQNVIWTWPIWENPIDVDILRSLLALKELQNIVVDREYLYKMGIVEVYRSRRITNGKYRNFSIAFPA